MHEVMPLVNCPNKNNITYIYIYIWVLLYIADKTRVRWTSASL